MKNKKYHTWEQFKKSIEKSWKEAKNNIPNTQLHDRSFFWLGTGTSIKKSGRAKLVLWAET